MENKVAVLSPSDTDIGFESLGVRVIDKQIIQEVFEQTVRNAYQQGLIENDENGGIFSGMLYPFYSRHVLCIYTHKKAGRQGIWYHLIDGSIWNSQGQQETMTKVEDFIGCCT